MNFETGPWHQLTTRTYLARCEPAGVNVGLVVGDHHTLLIDAGSHPDQGARLARSAQEMTGKAVDHLVITHWHWDHWLGAAGVGADMVVGHEELARWRDAPKLQAKAAELSVRLEQILLPSHPIVLAKAIDLGGVRVEIVHFGSAHTNSDLVVIVAEENVIFMGDLIEQGADPQFGEDSKVVTWPTALDGALSVADDDTRYVPGHGEVVDRDFVFRQRAELSMLTFEAERLARLGTPLADAVSAIKWPFEAHTVRAALALVYASAKGVPARRFLPVVYDQGQC